MHKGKGSSAKCGGSSAQGRREQCTGGGSSAQWRREQYNGEEGAVHRGRKQYKGEGAVHNGERAVHWEREQCMPPHPPRGTHALRALVTRNCNLMGYHLVFMVTCK